MGPHPPLNTGWLSKEYAWEAPNLWKVMINKTLQNRPRFTCVKLFRSLKLYTEEVVWGMDSGFAFKSKLIHTLLFIPFASHAFFAGVLVQWCENFQPFKTPSFGGLQTGSTTTTGSGFRPRYHGWPWPSPCPSTWPALDPSTTSSLASNLGRQSWQRISTPYGWTRWMGGFGMVGLKW